VENNEVFCSELQNGSDIIEYKRWEHCRGDHDQNTSWKYEMEMSNFLVLGVEISPSTDTVSLIKDQTDYSICKTRVSHKPFKPSI